MIKFVVKFLCVPTKKKNKIKALLYFFTFYIRKKCAIKNVKNQLVN